MPITRKTYLNELPPSVLFKLRSFFDPEEKWKELACVITNKKGEEKYTLDSVLQFSLEIQKGKSPTEALLRDWSYDNVSVEKLLGALAECKRFDVLRFLLVDKMNELTLDKFEEVSDSETGWDIYFDKKPKNNASQNSNGKPVENSMKNNMQSEQCDRVFDTFISQDEHVDVYDHAPNPLPIAEDITSEPVGQFLYKYLSELTDNFNNQPITEGGRLLGSGGYAQVFLATPPEQRRMAVKVLLERDHARNQFVQEVKVLEHFIHPNIVPLFGISQDGPHLCIVYEYMENGSLEERLQCKDDTTPLTNQERSRIAKGIAQGLNYLHTKNEVPYVHRDIKTANILLDYDFSAKIGDCGLAHRGAVPLTGKSYTTTKTLIGTAGYYAPEYIHGQISEKLDSYSFGIVLYEMVTALPVGDESWEEKVINHHVQTYLEDTGSIEGLVDARMLGWKKENVELVFKMAHRLTALDKKQRPKICEVLSEIMSWPQAW